MSKVPNWLFGTWMNNTNREARLRFRKYQLTRPLPGKVTGRPPSASSQTGLYHNDDFNSYWKISAFNNLFRRTLKPNVSKMDFYSENLGQAVRNIRTSNSAVYAMEDAGGFDRYIMNTSPENIRSNLAEKMKGVMYFFKDRPDIKRWALPWKVWASKSAQSDPLFARLVHLGKMRSSTAAIGTAQAKYSPYYLPRKRSDLFPERQEGSKGPALNLWWKERPEVEWSFRERLGQAKVSEEPYTDHREPHSYRKGGRKGGGGRPNKTVRPVSKHDRDSND